jgi:trehalose 6-phosphate phosphatase
VRTMASAGRIAEAVAPLRDTPDAAAIVLDVDGTLAPIVPRPEAASVSPEARGLLRALAARYGLVACLSGRRARDAARLVDVPELVYVGNHGLERLDPGDSEGRLDPAVAGHDADAARLVDGLDAGALARDGLRVEDKGPIQALHWREAADPEEAEAAARAIAERAAEAGLAPHWGRKVLELRPALALDKGTAVRALVGGAGARAAMYAGDDRTDLDAFRALRGLREEGALSDAVCVGIASPEGPDEVPAEADIVLGGPDEFLEVLRALAR